MVSATKAEVTRIERKLETREIAGSESNGERASDSTQTNDPAGEASGATEPERGAGKQEAAEKRVRRGRETIESNRPPDGGDAEAAGEPSPERNAGNGDPQRGNPGGDGTASEQAGGASNLMAKVSDAMSNLLSTLKPQSGGNSGDGRRNSQSGQKQNTKSTGDGRQNGAGQGPRGEGEQGEKREPDDSSGGSGLGADPNGEKHSGSSAGSENGSKDIRAAEQLDAMGKLSQILAKRSADLTGTMSVQVRSGPQRLTVAYSPRPTEHAPAKAEAERDQIPLDLESYINRYFMAMRQRGAATLPPHKRH
jgi:hypothetical protein